MKPSIFAVSAAAFTVAAAFIALFLTVPGHVQAHQPEGLRVSLSTVPAPPCPYGHDSVCETQTPLPAPNPYQGDQADAPVSAGTVADTGHVNRPSIRAIRYVRSSGGFLADDGTQETSGTVRAALTSDITGLPWVADGLTGQERVTRDWLSLLQDQEPVLASSLIGMPFLQDHNPGDRAAIESIADIAIGYGDAAFVTRTLAITALADDGGLDNEEAKIFSTFALAYGDGLFTDILVMAFLGEVEESTAQGRYNNSITYAVVRQFDGVDNSAVMAAAKTAVDNAEKLMGKALPTDFVPIAVHNGPGAGVNNGISIRVDDIIDTVAVTERYRLIVVAHEVGHFYWLLPGAENAWLTEGAAEYIAAYTEKQEYSDADLSTHFWPCSYYRTIEHLRADQPGATSSGSMCNYSLGERLFINLGRTMTDSAFATAFRKLHRDAEASVENGNDTGELLMKAFCSTCLNNPRNLGATGFTVARRYGERILTQRSAASGSVPRLGQVDLLAIEGTGGSGQVYLGFAEIPASSPDPSRWVRLQFHDVTNPPETARIRVTEYHEDREPWADAYQTLTVFSEGTNAWFYAYLHSPDRRPVGHHWVTVENETGQEIAQVEYQVTQ